MSKAGGGSDIADLIAIHSPNKYEVPKSVIGGPTGGKRRIVEKEDPATDAIEEDEGRKVNDVDAHIGAYHEPAVLADCLVISSNSTKPIWRDIDGNLIPAREASDKLRTGTLVLANVTVKCWTTNETKKPKKGERQGLTVRKKIHCAVFLCLPPSSTLP
ncbi:hypothetical protein JAAARDRAFT_208307 [Jaapia argillacea MUCL 33604]|uniref:Uncharacterized protein n=1 Tax=Jaapia argillacea MUCL 33604 TaxID=933084 RepID=A0A067PMR4_9AGAM|nr:hypothetical protein JAAARDRAFT_208307 [Jaapia argillacea MUCL 33604]